MELLPRSYDMVTPDRSDSELQFLEPLTAAEAKSDPATTLAWLETCIDTIYLVAGQKPFQRVDVPRLTRRAYLDVYSGVYEYCRISKIARGALSGEDLYRCLEHGARVFCTDAASQIRGQQSETDLKSSRHVFEGYEAQWRRLQYLAGLVSNLTQPLENDWIRRAIAEKRAKIHPIRELHTVIWKEIILQVGVDSSSAETGSEIAKAVATLREQEREEGCAGSGIENVKGFMDHLRTIRVR